MSLEKQKRNSKINAAVFIILLLTVICAPLTATEFADGKDSVALSINSCIEIAVKNNPDLTISKLNIAIQEQSIIKRESDFDPYFQAEAFTSENNQRSAATGLNSKTEALQSSAKIGSKLKTGADLSLAHSLKENENSQSSSLINPSYTSELSLNFSQPLLKNSGVKNNTAMLKIEKNNKHISDLNFKQKIIDIVSVLQKNYWQLAYSLEAYNVERQSLKLSEDLYNDNIKRVELGSLAQIEIVRAAAGVAEQNEKIISAENEILNQRDLMLSKMNLTKNLEFNNKIILPVDLPEPLVDVPTVDESLKYAFLNNPEFLALKKEFENIGIKIGYYENQKLPSLELQSSLGYNSTDESASKSYKNLNDNDNLNWKVGLVFSVPLGNKSNKATLQTEKYNLEKLTASLAKLENTIITDVNTKIRNIVSSIKQIRAAEHSVKLAQENLDAELKRFELNQTTTYDVLKFQESLSSAKIRLLKAVIDNRNAWIEYETVTGLLLEKNNIIL